MFARFLLLANFVLLFAFATTAQTARPAIRPPEPKAPDKHADEQEASRLPDDMRIKMTIARAEEDHKKILEDVQKLGDLSSEIARGYGERKRLTSDDLKKLGAVEKLAKRILTHAGGDQVDSSHDSSKNMLMAEAIDMMSTAAANIRKEMTAETRFVVSATVIANSNEVINLARFIRARKSD